MRIDAWPFLISRNQSIDYTAIVAPEFLVNAHCEEKIINFLDDDDDVLDKPLISQDEENDITLIYHAIPAKGDINYKDTVGRQIYRYEGVIIKGLNRTFDNPQEIISNAQKLLDKEFKKFWDLAAKPTIKTLRSFPIYIDNPKESEKPPFISSLFIPIVAFAFFLFLIIMLTKSIDSTKKMETLKTWVSKDGSTKDGSTKDGSTKDGSTKDGSTKDGSTKDGSTKDGSTKDGSTK